jgi:hypothetical protein
MTYNLEQMVEKQKRRTKKACRRLRGDANRKPAYLRLQAALVDLEATRRE